MVIKRAGEADGDVSCPECGEPCGEANLKVLNGRNNGYTRGATGSLWAYIGVEHTECGHEFEIGGPVGVTGKDA